MSIPVILLLSENGDSFSLKIHGQGFEDVRPTDKIHPDLRAALECKTHKTVLNFLNKLQGTENFKPFHMDGPTHSHYCASSFLTEKGTAHYCSIPDMIQFVCKKTVEESNSKKSKL